MAGRRSASEEPLFPSGILVAVGGAEDKEEDRVVLKRVLELIRGSARRVEVVPTASREPEEAAAPYIEALAVLGIRDVGVLDVRDREDALREDFLDRVDRADVVYFTGGDQLRLTSVLGGTPLLESILGRYRDGGIVAGTSAGAAALSATMIAHGASSRGSLRKGNVRMTPGLGFLPGVILDTHFTERGRFSRLVESITTNPGLLGVGLSEDTGVIIRGGRRMEVIGTNLVIVVDGQEVRHTNVGEASSDDPVSVERMIVHTLGDGYHFDLETRTYLPARARAASG